MSKDSFSQLQNPSTRLLVNPANGLTAARLLLAPVMAWAIMQQLWSVASLSMVLAIVTDVYDGKIARRQQHTSTFGGFFDHGTDAFVVSLGAWALADLALITPWLWPCITLAFLQYALDSRALAGQKLRTSDLGRFNGIGYYALVATGIGSQTLSAGVGAIAAEYPEALTDTVKVFAFLDRGIFWAAWLLVISSLASMADRLYHSLLR